MQPECKAGEEEYYRNIVVKYLNYKHIYRATSNKCGIARRAREKGLKTSNSRNQTNLDKPKRRKGRQIPLNKIVLFSNTLLQNDNSNTESDLGSN